MPITTFNELQQAIEEYLARTDTELNARTVDFIALFEGRLNRTLRVADMMAIASPTLSAFGTGSGSAGMPGDYLEWLQLTWTDGTRSADLRYVEPNSEEWRLRYRPFGDPSLFTVIASTLFLRPYRAGVLTFAYYKAIPALSVGNPTNWLLQRSPDVYLNGSLAEAYRYLKDEVRANDLMALVNADLAVLTGERDSNKVARRPPRQAELAGQAAARNPATGAA